MGKKCRAITIHISEETAEKVEQCAEQERRPVAQLLALWVEDVAEIESEKKKEQNNRPRYGQK